MNIPNRLYLMAVDKSWITMSKWDVTVLEWKRHKRTGTQQCNC